MGELQALAETSRPVSVLAIQFNFFGPYHLARLASAVAAIPDMEVVGVEVADSEYAYRWNPTEAGRLNKETLFPGKSYEDIPASARSSAMLRFLDEHHPEVVAIAGWASAESRSALRWCRRQGATSVLMSETRSVDGRRTWWKEMLKSRLVREFDTALVGGTSHRDYLVGLGFPEERIQRGYDIVDNHYFSEKAELWRQDMGDEKRGNPCFLASNRFVPRKNLARLLRAYAMVVQESDRSGERDVWDLCLVGDGEERSALVECCGELGLSAQTAAPWEYDTELATSGEATVFFPGFRQIEELPRFYAYSDCFVHPALSEPWGLVLNEAMASGLPVLSSNNVGAAEELLEEGVNGWTFDPNSVESMAQALLRVTKLSGDERNRMGIESRNLLTERYPVESFGKGLEMCVRQGGN